MRCLLTSLGFILGMATAALPALAAKGAASGTNTYTYGLGLSARLGEFAGVPATGASLSLRLSKFEVEGSVFRGTSDIKTNIDSNIIFGTSSSSIAKAQVNQFGELVMLKMHPADGSFYLGFGAGQTQASSELKATDSSSGIDETIKSNRTIGVLSIGNVWTPGGVIIGCEWFGWVNAFARHDTVTVNTSPGSDATLTSLQSSFYNEVRSKTEDNTTNYLLVYFGIMIGG